MESERTQFDFGYAVMNTEVVKAPSKALETFGDTRVNYRLVAELADDPRKIRVREGRLEAHKPAIITPERYAREHLEGFGEQARAYLEFLREHEDSVRILQYGYCLRQEAFSEQVVSGTIDEVTARVVADAEKADDPFAVVIKGVDDPWDVCLVRFFWLHVNASAAVNVRELEQAHAFARFAHSSDPSRPEVEAAFAAAERDPSLVRELGALLKRKGVFERYQDRFFKLVRRG